MVQALLELHGVALERMLDIIWERGSFGEAIIHQHLPKDSLVSSLLLLHGLHPLSLQDRVQQALDKVRPYLKSHGGNVEIVDIRDGVVRLQMQGSCESCPASSLTLKYAVEDAIYEVAPDVVSVMSIDKDAKAGLGSFIPLANLDSLGAAPADEAKWHKVDGLSGLADRNVEKHRVNGRFLLFTRLDSNLYAYDDTCPHCHQDLALAYLEDTALVCPNCHQTYDVIRAGRGLDTPGIHLEPFPLLVEEGQVRIALPV
jgi:Fe-S cluster biogenesis protein NfuA/nitrite reductase/ring-hydroxylating ferredoxin subunit